LFIRIKLHCPRAKEATMSLCDVITCKKCGKFIAEIPQHKHPKDGALCSGCIEEGKFDQGDPCITDDLQGDIEAMVEEGVLSYEEYHVMMGQYSGYSMCCIKNFINLKKLGFPPARFMEEVLGHKHDLWRVLCPMCYDKLNKQ
jgi:hypothetical protein